jgi:hypothetical protein
MSAPAVVPGHSPTATMDYYDDYGSSNNGQTTTTTSGAGMTTSSFLEHSGHHLTSYTNAGIPELIFQAVLWIRNFSLRIWIRLFNEFRIRLSKSSGSGSGSNLFPEEI